MSLTEEQRKKLQELSIEKSEVLKALGVELSDLADLFAEYHRGVVETKELELEFLAEPKRQNLKDLLFRMAQQQLAARDDQRKSDDIEQKTQSAISRS